MSGIYSALCTKLHATQPLARDVSTLLEGERGLLMIALEGLCFSASYLQGRPLVVHTFSKGFSVSKMGP